MIRFLHAADIHLDSPFRNLRKNKDILEKIQNAPRTALKNLVQVAIQENVDFVLIAGDIYDKKPDIRTRQFFNLQMSLLGQKGIPVYLVSGNHDADSLIGQPLEHPRNVFFFSSKAPQTFPVIKGDKTLPVAIHGQSFLERETNTNLAAKYLPPESGKINIGLLHTSLEMESKDSVHIQYAPVGVNELVNKGYDYWALGHIHQRKEVRQEKPWIVYPGNTQGRHIKETGAKGCYLVSLDAKGKADLKFVPLDEFRFETLQVDLKNAQEWRDVFEELEKAIKTVSLEKPTAIRVYLTGQTPLHEILLGDETFLRESLQNRLNDIFPGNLFLESTEINTQPPPGFQESSTVHEDAKQLILQEITHIQNDSEALKAAIKESEEIKNILSHIPSHFKKQGGIQLNDHNWLTPLLSHVGPLIEKLSKESGGEK